MSGKFITVEGPDGAGKTTGLYWLFDYLKENGVSCIRTREPGGTPIAEQFREQLLMPRPSTQEQLTEHTELLLMWAARSQHVKGVIEPHMQQGNTVLCDRFSDSSWAYQAVGRGFRKEVRLLERIVLNGFEPDVTLYFAAPLKLRMKRLAGRSGKTDRLDQESLDFFRRVQRGYEERFRKNPHRMVRIDATGDVESVRKQLKEWADAYFNIPPKP